MRLWHYELIEKGLLPDSQLKAQKREVDLILKDIKNGKKTNHILINYIWEYENPWDELDKYYRILQKEFSKRGIRFKDNLGIASDIAYFDPIPFKEHHNENYLLICYYNLKEKYINHQKDFEDWRFESLKNYVFFKHLAK